MTVNAFIGKTQPPTEQELAAALGPAKRIWDQLIAALAGSGIVDQEWNSYSLKAGWALRLKCAQRNIVYLSPGQGAFLVAFALGDRAVQAARKARLPAAVIKTINEAKRYPEGTAVRLEIRARKDIAAIEKLAAIKLAN